MYQKLEQIVKFLRKHFALDLALILLSLLLARLIWLEHSALLCVLESVMALICMALVFTSVQDKEVHLLLLQKLKLPFFKNHSDDHGDH